ncbi:hypothetical protein BHM03_00044299 [Ensete ventricosum]|nr:hypothetical protein BHM03_00044299 [Ensete ventricosum]
MSSLVEAQGKDSGSRSCNYGKGLEMVAMSRGRRGVGVGDSRKNYDGESRVGRNVISAGGAGELQRQLAMSDEEEGKNSDLTPDALLLPRWEGLKKMQKVWSEGTLMK